MTEWPKASDELEQLRLENRQLKARVGELQRELAMRPHGRPKGLGSHYNVMVLSSMHRKVLYTLLEMGAVSEATGVPAVEIRRRMRMGQGPLSGRISELIRKGHIATNKVRISFQVVDGTVMYRPETQLDPNLGVKRYKRFIYLITASGKQALLESVQPTDDFARADLETLTKVKRAAEEKQG